MKCWDPSEKRTFYTVRDVEDVEEVEGKKSRQNKEEEEEGVSVFSRERPHEGTNK